MLKKILFPFCRYKTLSFLSGNRRDVVMERVYDLLEKREIERERPTDSSSLTQNILW